MKRNLQFIAALLVLSLPQAFSQNKPIVQKNTPIVLNESQLSSRTPVSDSLAGFNEQQARDIAPFKGITAEEMDMYMAISKREYVKSKYNLVSKPNPEIYAYSAKTASAVCVNEDFEEEGLTTSVPNTVNAINPTDINGWIITNGTNSGSTGSCILSGCCSGSIALNAYEIGADWTGYIDPIIGSAYPLYSVFGNVQNIGTSINGFSCYGDWFVKINNQTPGAGITRISKTINVTPSNVKFKFASIAVAQGAHCCCDNVGIAINFRDCLGNMLATSAQFSVSPSAGTGCSPSGPCTTGAPITFYNAATAGWQYNKWRVDSVDLSLWLGSCIKIEVTAIDCPYSGHAGYAYFDAQCGSFLSTNVHYYNYKQGVNLYPNPSSGNFNVDISTGINNGELELRNVLGQTVHKQQVKQGNNQINTQNLAKGIYTYSVLQNKELVNTGKLVIE